ncbi:alpha/beta hydrolase [Glaciecola sp. XM2]|uniref:alpha/beta hydrolase n=1 Tax=Glaciecola sp. XM2 TaxID=1914931 RepID=UPI003324767E
MTQQEVHFLDGQIAALVSGQQNSSPILFVHGFLDNAASFDDVVSHLANHYCIAIDLPGHGKSAHRSKDAHYHLTDYVYDLHRLIESNDFTNVTLVGHSLGGIISSIYCALYPNKVANLVVIESLGPLTEPEFTTVAQLRGSMASRDKANGPIKHPKSMEDVVAARMRVSDLSASEALRILSRNIVEYDGALKWRTDKRLRTQSAIRMTPNQAMNIIENIQCTFNLVLGDRGFTKIKRMLKHRRNIFKHFNMVEFKGGHHVHMQAPDKVAEFIINVMNTH